MAAYRQIPCQHCGRDDGTVVGAHGWGRGRGKGIKADDLCASLCFRCHTELDQGNKLDRMGRETMWSNAYVKTVRELVRRGLWPLNVEIPDIRRFN